MKKDEDLRKIKELLEIVKHKVGMMEVSRRGQSAQLSLMKDQQSVINEKLDNLSESLDEKFAAAEKRVLGEIGKFVEDEILPAIDEKADKADIDRIERKLDNFGARVMEHGQRLDTIEFLPTIAHELRVKK